jgi:hypothetical protein
LANFQSFEGPEDMTPCDLAAKNMYRTIFGHGQSIGDSLKKSGEFARSPCHSAGDNYLFIHFLGFSRSCYLSETNNLNFCTRQLAKADKESSRTLRLISLESISFQLGVLENVPSQNFGC